MPELPEVETIRRGLAESLPGQIITEVTVLFQKSFDVELELLTDFVSGAQVNAVKRRGKVLIIELNNAYSMLIHLKMTGQLVLVKAAGKRFAGGHPTKSLEEELPDKSTRVSFTLDSGDKLFFNDQRKFGWIKLVESHQVESDKLLARMGPEPLEAAFIYEDFINKVGRRKSPIKAVLLDQATVAGLGNIYVDEALHLAKIHPKTLASDVPKSKLKKLHQAIIEVLEASLGFGGTSFTNYVNALGVKGNYLDNARVFKKEGQPCLVCGALIQKLRVAGRGTYICPHCQKL